MNSESHVESTQPAGRATQAIEGNETSIDRSPLEQPADRQATVIVRGETVRDQQTNLAPHQPPAVDKDSPSGKRRVSEAKQEVSEARLKMRGRLPALDDDGDVGVQKEQLVIRDEKADLTFTGTLIASAAPASTSESSWGEYRIYETSGGKHVFSKVTRTVFANEPDRHEAEVFDPAPSSVPSQLLRSARDLTRSRPMAWTDAAVSFFGYNSLAKALYRKLGDQFDEHIS
jgi:hypothetical protein